MATSTSKRDIFHNNYSQSGDGLVERSPHSTQRCAQSIAITHALELAEEARLLVRFL
ncbi:hypothetical protein [Nostoc sp.]|uniref:hypothetical protein n=1 Tax=Nostoc sp. TaxID=1180 RepID=UPI002FF63EBF